MGVHGSGLGDVPCPVCGGAFSADLEYRSTGNAQKSGEGVSYTEKHAGYPETYHCGAVFLFGVPVSLWRQFAPPVFAAVPAGNLRVIGVFSGAAHTVEVKEKGKEKGRLT